MDYYDYDDDYGGYGGGLDPCSLDFQMYGHGGFGYDTSHVKADDPEPAFVAAAKCGDLAQVKEMVEKAREVRVGDCVRIIGLTSSAGESLNGKEGKVVAAANAEGRVGVDVGTGQKIKLLKAVNVASVELRCLLNQSRRWTEVDYKMSGFTKEYEWHDLTAVAAAAMHGHPHIVRYLLLTGLADPTLKGCYADDLYADAFEAASVKGWRNREVADQEQCRKLLDAAAPFWKKNDVMSGARYSEKRLSSGFSNIPTSLESLRAAVDAIPIPSEKQSGKEAKKRRAVDDGGPPAPSSSSSSSPKKKGKCEPQEPPQDSA